MPYDYKYDMFFLSYENYLFIKICKIVNSKNYTYIFLILYACHDTYFSLVIKKPAIYLPLEYKKKKKKVYELPMYIYLAKEINLSSRSTLQLIKTATN